MAKAMSRLPKELPEQSPSIQRFAQRAFLPTHGSVSTAPAFTINFDNETDEWNLTDYNVNTNSLFKKFYANYVDSLFDSKKRMYKVKAYLTTEVFINMRLNDRLIINNRVFTINSIKTNLKTEVSEIELLNVVDNELPS